MSYQPVVPWVERKMLSPTLAFLVRLWLKPELQMMPCIIQKKMEQNENERQCSLGLLQTMTALQPKFHDVTLVWLFTLTRWCWWMSTLCLRAFKEAPTPCLCEGGGATTQCEDNNGWRIDHRQYSLGLWQVRLYCFVLAHPALLLRSAGPASLATQCSGI